MLGLGLGLNKNTVFKKYALDYIPGGVENNVFWLSYYQMTGRRNDECFRLRDLTTSDEWDIGRVSGYVDYNRVLTLLSGHTGLATKIYNNSWAAGAQDAIQTNIANMPIVATGGVFNHDGFKFDVASSNYMTIVDYAGVQIIEPKLSIYANYYNTTNHNGYIIAKNTDSSANMQYSLQTYFDKSRFIESGSVISSVDHLSIGNNKSIITWDSKNANGFYHRSNANILQTTLNTTFTNRTRMTIGARAYYDNYYDGNIKTISISADNLYNYYNILAARC
jgi:hypothetical protein